MKTDTPSKILDRAMLSACAEAGYAPVSDLVEYDKSKDLANSLNAAYSAIRARVAAGGSRLGAAPMTARHASMSEQQLQENVVKLLNSYARHDIAWWCCPNGSLRTWKVGVRLKQAGLRAGASDLMFLIDGKFHAVELKTEIGVVKSNQHDFAESVTRAGGFFHAAFGLYQAIGVLTAISAFRPGITFTTAAFDGRGVRTRPWQSKDTKAATQSVGGARV